MPRWGWWNDPARTSCWIRPSEIIAQGPLRRAAEERKGPIAKQWVGEVVGDKHGLFLLPAPQPTSPSRASRGPLPLPPLKRAERAFESRWVNTIGGGAAGGALMRVRREPTRNSPRGGLATWRCLAKTALHKYFRAPRRGLKGSIASWPSLPIVSAASSPLRPMPPKASSWR